MIRLYGPHLKCQALHVRGTPGHGGGKNDPGKTRGMGVTAALLVSHGIQVISEEEVAL